MTLPAQDESVMLWIRGPSLDLGGLLAAFWSASAAAAIMHDGPATDSNVVVYSSARGCKQAVRPDGRMLGELESTPEIVVAPFARLWWRPGRAPTKRCKETSGK